jgi:hypothetical protein
MATSASTNSNADAAAMPAAKVLPAMKAVLEDALSVDTIKVKIKRRLCTMEKEKKQASNVRNPYRKANDEKYQTWSYSAPAQVVAFLGYLLSLVPSKAEASEWATLTNEKLAFYKRVFSPGTMSFTIPKDDMTKGPSDPDYAILQGVTVHIM